MGGTKLDGRGSNKKHGVSVHLQRPANCSSSLSIPDSTGLVMRSGGDVPPIGRVSNGELYGAVARIIPIIRLNWALLCTIRVLGYWSKVHIEVPSQYPWLHSKSPWDLLDLAQHVSGRKNRSV